MEAYGVGHNDRQMFAVKRAGDVLFGAEKLAEAEK
jgi:hypothetical protein